MSDSETYYVVVIDRGDSVVELAAPAVQGNPLPYVASNPHRVFLERLLNRKGSLYQLSPDLKVATKANPEAEGREVVSLSDSQVAQVLESIKQGGRWTAPCVPLLVPGDWNKSSETKPCQYG